MLVRFDTCNEFQPHHSNRPDIVRWTTCRFVRGVDSSHRLEQYLEAKAVRQIMVSDIHRLMRRGVMAIHFVTTREGE